MPFKRIGITLALFMAGCGSSNNLPVQPQIAVSPTGDYFGTDLCLGTYIGEAPEGDLFVTNGGQDPLTINSITLATDSDTPTGIFQLSGPNLILPDGGTQTGTPMTLLSQQDAFLQVIFTPTEQKKYTGTITIESNAANMPTLVVPLRGVGVPPPLPDGGVNPADLPDAGISPDCTGDGGQTS
jgi:hypothetical protein